MERHDSFIDSGKNSKIQLSTHKNVRGFDSEIDVSYLKNGKLVHKSYSDTGENLLGRNNNKDLSFLSRIKCFVGLGTHEECHPEDYLPKHSSAPPCLTQQETLDLLEQKTQSLRSRLENLEVVTEQLTAKKECLKKKKKKKCNPYIEFYSRICSKKPPKPCIQPVQLNPEETTQLRTVVTRSRSPTPCRRSRSPRQKPKRQKCKCSEQNLPEIKSSQTNSKMFCISSCPPRSSEYTPGSYSNMDNKFYRARPNCDNYTLPCGKQASQTQFNARPRNRSTSRKIQNNMSMQSPKGLQNQRNNGDIKECPCKKEKQKSESFQFQKPRPRPATASPCRSCNPVNLMHGFESDCIFAGLGASYNRSKSGDSAAKMLLAKYKHALPGDYGTQCSMSKCPSGDEKNSVMTSGNRTNSRRPDSPDQRNRQSQNAQNCISYASQPKKQKHHKKVELFSPCMKEIGPRSPVELFHALKRAEGWEKRKRSPTLKQSVSAEKQQVPKPPFTMEVLEQEILENRFGKKSKKKGEKNKNASAVSLELDSFDMVNICASNDSYYCPKSCRNHSVYFLKKCYNFATHDLENISYHPELHEEYSFKQTNDIIGLDCKCKNNNFGDENFRFFRQYLNITPGPSDAQSPSTAGQGDADLPAIDSQTLINNVVDAYNVTETFGNNSQTQSQSELEHFEHLENKMSRMDNWILGEFPENISTKINKTTSITRKRSSGGVSNIGGNKKRSTTRVVNKKVPIKKSVVTRKNIEIIKRPQTKRSEIIQNQKHQKFINSETSIVSPNNITHSNLPSPRKTSEVSFSSPERYLPQIVSESNISEESIDFFNDIEKSPILKQEDKVVPQMETKRSAKSSAMESPRKVNEKQWKSVKYSNRQLSPRTPVTRSEDNRYIPIERINEQISAQRELNNSPENSESGESSVDGEISVSKIPEQSSGASFISRFTSFWKSKPSPELACHVEKRTSDLILCGKESSVDLVDQDHCKESSVDLVSRDGSSNNGYFSSMEKTSLSEETSNFLRNIESIEPGECVGDRMFEFDQEFGKSTSFCIKDNDDFIQENISNNNGGNTEDENAEEEETKTDNGEAQKPVQTTPTNESSCSPSSTPQSAVTNPLLQQLFASSGVTWTKISPGDVDVANIRRAKEEFMKRQRAKKAAEVTPHPEATGGCNDENLTLDLPVISRKKTIPIEVINALAEESEQQIDTGQPDGALCEK